MVEGAQGGQCPGWGRRSSDTGYCIVSSLASLNPRKPHINSQQWGIVSGQFPLFLLLCFHTHTHTQCWCVCVRGRRHDVLQSEPSDRRSLSDAAVFAVHVSKYQAVIGAVSYSRPFPPFPPRSPPSATATLGAPAVPRPERFIGQLSEERLLPRGLLARAWLVDSFSISGVLFDMSFKSFKELGVSAERLGSFCKRWMARVQRSGCFSPLPQSLSPPPPSFLPSNLSPSSSSPSRWALWGGISVVS